MLSRSWCSFLILSLENVFPLTKSSGFAPLQQGWTRSQKPPTDQRPLWQWPDLCSTLRAKEIHKHSCPMCPQESLSKLSSLSSWGANHHLCLSNQFVLSSMSPIKDITGRSLGRKPMVTQSHWLCEIDNGRWHEGHILLCLTISLFICFDNNLLRSFLRARTIIFFTVRDRRTRSSGSQANQTS